MDNKGRVSIPMRFREILQERQERQLILTNWDGYILAYPHNEWVKLEAKLAELKTFNKNNRNFKRFLLSGVEECPLDRQGRILIPQSLREYAKLGREIAIVGQVQNFEIWDRERYEANRKQLEESIDESMFDELLI
jgi:MraZ protein